MARRHRPPLHPAVSQHADVGYGGGLSRRLPDRGDEPLRGPGNHPAVRTLRGSLGGRFPPGGGAGRGGTPRSSLPPGAVPPHLPQVRERRVRRGDAARHGSGYLPALAHRHRHPEPDIRRLWPGEFAWRTPPYEYELVRLPIDILAGSPDIREGIEAGRTTAEIADAGRRRGGRLRCRCGRVLSCSYR